MTRRIVEIVILIAVLFLIGVSASKIGIGTVFINPPPDYQGSIDRLHFVIYIGPDYVIHILALGSVIPTIGLVTLSYPRYSLSFWIALLIVNFPIMYVVWTVLQILLNKVSYPFLTFFGNSRITRRV